MGFLYTNAKTLLMTQDLDLTGASIKVQAVDATYVDDASHVYLTAVAGGSRVGPVKDLTTPTVVSGVWDADDLLYTDLTGDIVTGFVFYWSTGVEATSPLILYKDESEVGIPYTPRGASVWVRWSDGPNKIWAL